MEFEKNMVIPIYEFGTDGAIIPNTVFHRPHIKLHSRCIEYPFAASRLAKADKVLDIGTAKSDKYWVQWLAGLEAEVYATDFEGPSTTLDMGKIKFVKSDIRRLPFKDNFFDAVFAVSTIEHIGLENPQVFMKSKPFVEKQGDFQAVRELCRILKPSGRLIMTVPFGSRDGLSRDGDMRTYTSDSIKKFDALCMPLELEYYQYCQAKPAGVPKVVNILRNTVNEFTGMLILKPGEVTWRRVPVPDATAVNFKQTEGVLCGVWEKKLPQKADPV